MKRILFALCIILLSTSLIADFEFYGIRSGKIEYELSGNTTGTKTIWFDNYGRRQRTELNSSTTVKMMGIENTTTEHTLSIKTDEFLYFIDLQDNTGSKNHNPAFYNDPAISEMTDAEKQAYFNKTLADLGGEKLGNETFLGKKCDVISLMGNKSWIYEGITLKSETSIMGITNVITATGFQENIEVKDDLFLPPAGIEFYDYEQSSELYSDFEEEDDFQDDSDMDQPEITFDEFDSVVRSANIAGYTLQRSDKVDGNYQAIFMGENMNYFMIMATYFEPALLKESDDIDLNSKFDLNGHDAYYSTTEDGLSMISLTLQKSMTMVSIIFMNPTEKDTILDIFNNFKF